MRQVPPSLGLIVDMARRALGEEASDLRAPVDGDWEHALELATREGVAALVYSGVRSSPDGVPAGVASQFRAAYLGARLRLECHLEPGIGLLLGLLREARVYPVVLKGAALAYTAYPDPALRSMGDIDLLVAQPQIADAQDTLMCHGFTVVDFSNHSPGHHLPLLSSRDRHLKVELHHCLLPKSSPYAVDVDEFRSRCREVEIGSTIAVVPDPTDALQHACFHLAYSHRYRWFSLRSLVDILALTGSMSRSIDWHLFLETSRKWRTGGAAYWPLRLSRDLLDAPVPEHVLAALSPSPLVERLFASSLRSEYLLGLATPPDRGDAVLNDLVLSLSLCGGCPQSVQIRAVMRGLFPPPEAVSHLPREVQESRCRYLFHMARPERLARGLAACWRLAVASWRPEPLRALSDES